MTNFLIQHLSFFRRHRKVANLHYTLKPLQDPAEAKLSHRVFPLLSFWLFQSQQEQDDDQYQLLSTLESN